MNSASKVINNKVFVVIFLINLTTPLTWSLVVRSDHMDLNSQLGEKLILLSKTADVKAFMNTEFDPCDNFYDFACGTWKHINPAQLSGSISTDKFQTLTNGIKRKLDNLLLKEKSGNGSVEDKIKDFYASCLNAKADNTKYSQALRNAYEEFGQFSVFKTEEEKMQKNFQWWSTVAKIKSKYGKSIILSLFILDHLKDKSRTMAYVGPPEFHLIQAGAAHVIQKNRISRFFELYFNVTKELSTQIANEIIDFERKLIKGATDVRLGHSVEDLLTLYNTTDLIAKYNFLFDIKEYLEIVLNTKDLPPQVYVYDESYLEELFGVLNSTDDDIVENYILWLFVEEYIVGITNRNLKSECTEKTKKYFGKFIDHTIYNQYRSKEIEDEVFELWDDIKSTFRHSLQTHKYYWMSNATREEAIKKLNNINLTINSYDSDDFIEFFKNLDIDTSNYVLNIQNILEHSESLHKDKMEKKSEEDAQVLSFTPVYNTLENNIKIPVTLLQPRFLWDPKYPKAIKYGTLGYLIAHEMIHAFDDEGRKYDANANANNWWDEKSSYEFTSRSKCFQEQYHKYKYDGKLLPRSVSQSENIADNGGVNIAYLAYVNWLNKQKETFQNVESYDTLPRLDYNNRQLFFISFAQIWCEDVHSLFQSSLVNGDVHAPGMFRVIGSLSNSREFSWIFKCNEKTSRMDPPKKCEIY